MTSAAKMAGSYGNDLATRTVLAIAGLLLSLLGAVIATGGLLDDDGSAFYVLAGGGLILSGTFVARRHRAGAWTYMAVFAATVAWSLRHLEGGGAPLAERLVGPSVLLAMIALLMPFLRGWRPLMTAIVAAALMMGTVGLALASTEGGPLADSTAAVTQMLDTQTDGVLQ